MVRLLFTPQLYGEVPRDNCNQLPHWEGVKKQARNFEQAMALSLTTRLHKFSCTPASDSNPARDLPESRRTNSRAAKLNRHGASPDPVRSARIRARYCRNIHRAIAFHENVKRRYLILIRVLAVII